MVLQKVFDFVTRHWAPLTVSVLVLFLGYTVSQYGFISVEVKGGQAGEEYVYSIAKDGDGRTKEIRSSSPKLSRFVRRADYEVLVRQTEQMSMAATAGKGFFGTRRVTIELSFERQRSFAGNSPKSCMYLADSVLFSHDCDSQFTEVETHVPASKSIPTHTQQVFSEPEGSLRGTVNLEGVVYGLFDFSHDTLGHQLYRLTKTGVVDGRPLDDLLPGEQYSITAYLDGFLVYNQGYNHVLYYATAAATPEALPGLSAEDEGLSPTNLSVWGESVLAVYQDVSAVGVGDIDFSPKAGRSELVFYSRGSVGRIKIGKNIGQAILCGQEAVCFNENFNLLVHRLVGGKLEFLYSLADVNTYQAIGGSLLIHKAGNLINFDVAKKHGFSEYSFGNYQLCGLKPGDNSYLVCVIGPGGQRSALYIDQSKANQDSIDKKLAALGTLPEVLSISAQGNVVFITPNRGEIAYDQNLGGFTYNKAYKEASKKAIELAITRLGLDKTGYVLIII